MAQQEQPLILLVSEDGGELQGLNAVLVADGCRVELAGSSSEATTLFHEHKHSFVLVDLRDPPEAMKTLEALRAADKSLPMVALAERSQTKEVARAIEKGANDWVPKPADAAKLLPLVRSLISRRPELGKPVSLEGGLREEPNFRKIVGSSEKIRNVFESIKIVTGSDVPVLIQGETGTGKELVAMAIHYRGPRRSHPFFPVNCAAIPETLLESELFGHERGAFTGAVERRKGKFEMADGGTLFLDEIAEMPPATQAKILRVIEDHSFRRVGGNDLIHVDVRIVSASNKDVKKEVEGGRFREDLYYRLSVFPIYLPALRERRNDIVELANYFLQKAATETGTQPKALSEAAVKAMLEHAWPGNVRELQNTLKRAALLAGDGAIEPTHLGLWQAQAPAVGSAAAMEQQVARLLTDLQKGQIVPLSKVEEVLIRQALNITEGNITEAANRLGVSRSTIYRKLQEYGISC